MRKRQEEGIAFHLFFLWLPEPEMAIARVAARVAAGGHHIPENDIRRRYQRGTSNFFEIYMALADTWEVYDTSFDYVRPIAAGKGQSQIEILDSETWRKFKQARE